MDYVWVYQIIQYCILAFFIGCISDFRKKGPSELLVNKHLITVIRCLYFIPIIIYASVILRMETFKFQDLFALILTFNGTFLVARAKYELADQHRWPGFGCSTATKIKTNGIYAYLRHPMYTGMYIFAIGSLLTMLLHATFSCSFYVYLVTLFVALGYLVFISNRETKYLASIATNMESYRTQVHSCLPLKISTLPRESLESRYSSVLFFSHLAGMIVITTGVVMLQEAGLTKYHLTTTLIIGVLGLLISLSSNKNMLKDLNINRVLLHFRVSIWITFILDLGTIAYLIYFSGGISSSPFGSYLILVPTIGLFLGIAPAIVSMNYLCAAIIAVVLVVLYSDVELEHSGYYFLAVGITFISAMGVALVGNFIRAKWSFPKGKET